jgi:thymidine phosphorylase
MLFTDIIRTKRDGGELSEEQIRFIVGGLADDSLPAEQVSALAMAIFLNSMSFAEAAALTLGMAHSGTVLEWDAAEFDGPVVDKHSTGGVGDKVSFLLAPIIAACGCFVPMISGRGLGHTGGTTDKAESIPGYNATPDLDTFRRVVREAGCAIIGQTPELAPADRRFYAIRDVTGTVESIPLITASILSKKIAAGLQGLVMDVKVGNGAFMEDLDRARELGRSIIATAAQAGLSTHAVITDMNEVLGATAGNALEIAEAVRFLRNEVREPRLEAVTLALCAEMLVLAGEESSREQATKRCDEALSSGRAAAAFGRMVSALGGPADFVERYADHLPAAPVTRAVHADGIVAGVDTRAVGNAIIELGGGRRRVGETLDLAVGFSRIAPVGTVLDADVPLAVVHAATEEAAERAAAGLRDAVTLATEVPDERSVIVEILTGEAGAMG